MQHSPVNLGAEKSFAGLTKVVRPNGMRQSQAVRRTFFSVLYEREKARAHARARKGEREKDSVCAEEGEREREWERDRASKREKELGPYSRNIPRALWWS